MDGWMELSLLRLILRAFHGTSHLCFLKYPLATDSTMLLLSSETSFFEPFARYNYVIALKRQTVLIYATVFLGSGRKMLSSAYIVLLDTHIIHQRFLLFHCEQRELASIASPFSPITDFAFSSYWLNHRKFLIRRLLLKIVFRPNASFEWLTYMKRNQ